ncbi:MAG TPA: Na+/H+ antiporter NhaC [Candidatus Faecalicoccus intestinipullorum]|nr:Na+/H+ antiporter NhaC [Candidatus Faecalicoccus intestinipullorum]
MKREKKKPTTAFALGSFLLIIAVLVVLINLGVNTTVSIFIGAVVAVGIALALGISWDEIESTIKQVIADSTPTFLIVIMVGMLVGIWMAGGTVPALMYYGMKLISPSILVPLAFILSSITSIFTGTSFGSVATMGLAMVGIAMTTDLSIPLVVGAVVSGAWLGDKMSPLSDTTNMASGVSKVPLYDHIGSMMYTTLPAAAVAIVLFAIAGFASGGGSMDASQSQLIMTTLENNFNMSLILIVPAILVLLVSVFKMPAILGMGLTVIVSAGFAMLFQGVGFVELMNYAFNGFSIETGVSIVDPMLNRGGVTSMMELLGIFMVASVMGAVITSTGILDVIAKNVLLRFIKNRVILVFTSLVYCYIVNFLAAGGQIVSIIVTEQTFEETYDRMGIHRKVLSRTLEDAGTLSAPIVPWGVATIYVMSVLSVDASYIPYCWFIFLVPVFSILCAVTGIGIWNTKGEKMWGKNKAEASLIE